MLTCQVTKQGGETFVVRGSAFGDKTLGELSEL
jgi:hypothetical protein